MSSISTPYRRMMASRVPLTSPLRFGIARCSGPGSRSRSGWGSKSPSGRPVPGDGPVRGWTDRSCTQQSEPCSAKQFDYPWSPLPAGVTECSFGALSNDRDPPASPYTKHRTATPLSWATCCRRPSILAATPDPAQVQVIGFSKGWFLIEAGPNLDLPFDATPTPSSIRRLAIDIVRRPGLGPGQHADGGCCATR